MVMEGQYAQKEHLPKRQMLLCCSARNYPFTDLPYRLSRGLDQVMNKSVA